ncbi:CBS domain-containing protein [Natrinema sp. SYSU A 869]|uniref:CBS domain-containing protein n=1 Tax=Natrinema sp. SYSU A 869 TaxID=2871694 RepID=UPI001CA43786|nr:CBS domain-containing protein [Natrinema sp. SYSU A 869]
MPVKDIARPREELVSAEPTASLREICQLMDDKRVGCVVIESDEEPAGIITDRDIAMAFSAGKTLDDLAAEDIMNREPHTVSTDDGVFDLCATMAEHGVRRMPVVEGEKLTGIVTFDDLVVLLDDEMSNLSNVVRTESPAYETS